MDAGRCDDVTAVSAHIDPRCDVRPIPDRVAGIGKEKVPSTTSRDRGQGNRHWAMFGLELRQGFQSTSVRIDIDRDYSAYGSRGDPDIRVGSAAPPLSNGCLFRGPIIATVCCDRDLVSRFEGKHAPAASRVGERSIQESICHGLARRGDI